MSRSYWVSRSQSYEVCSFFRPHKIPRTAIYAVTSWTRWCPLYLHKLDTLLRIWNWAMVLLFFSCHCWCSIKIEFFSQIKQGRCSEKFAAGWVWALLLRWWALELWGAPELSCSPTFAAACTAPACGSPELSPLRSFAEEGAQSIWLKVNWRAGHSVGAELRSSHRESPVGNTHLRDHRILLKKKIRLKRAIKCYTIKQHPVRWKSSWLGSRLRGSTEEPHKSLSDNNSDKSWSDNKLFLDKIPLTVTLVPS